ncbi:MAG: hypothetical protein HC880_14905 [Bacteroidia bacterium]|nr:hypothetical protein [Bacteroidia bacterium]
MDKIDKMSKKATEFVNNADKNNLELYGKEAAEFINDTASDYARLLVIAEVIPKTVHGDLAREQLTKIAASLATTRVKLLNIPQDVVYSYVELGKKLALDTLKFIE